MIPEPDRDTKVRYAEARLTGNGGRTYERGERDNGTHRPNNVSEELRAKGYLRKGKVRGDFLGNYRSFILGASTLGQLAAAGIVPKRAYGSARNRKPDGLIVDRRDPAMPQVVLVIEHKDSGELNSEDSRKAALDKAATVYCKALTCRLVALTDGTGTWWAVVDPTNGTWQPIVREDGFLFSADVGMATADDRRALALSLALIEEQLDYATGVLSAPAVVDPSQLAERVWQSVWLASMASPDQCLATFVEILIFKFLSDLAVLGFSASGVPVDFDTVRSKDESTVLHYYWEHVRPTIKALFPPSAVDGTSVLNGTVFDPTVEDHGRLFLNILSEFHRFGSLKRIDPQFRSRVFERFLRNTIPQKNLGQYFTPRNVVKAMVEMSGIEHLSPGAVVADPACGVGGFVLEPLVHSRPADFRSGQASTLTYRGYDRDEKTIILAKANMLIHLAELIESDPVGAVAYLAPVLNKTFTAVHNRTIGTLAEVPRNQFDLVMTNPPYVVKGTTEQKGIINADEALRDYFDTPSTGVEGLFVQLVINGLKPAGRALVVIPDGILMRHSDAALRRRLLEQCDLEAIVSLPTNTFYTTPKKTYVLVIRKKAAPAVQTNPVFTYLIGSVGETLDAKRFVIPDNDLPAMASLFKLFQGNPPLFKPTDPRCKVQAIDQFDPAGEWLVDRWWDEEELRTLGDTEEIIEATPTVMAERLEVLRQGIDAVEEQLRMVPKVADGPFRDVAVSDKALFDLSIGKRVVKKELHLVVPGPVPLYSANVLQPFGMLDKSKLKPGSFDVPSVLWGIDGDFVLNSKDAGEVFDITDHCGRCRVLDPNIDAGYVKAALALARERGFDRTLRPSLQRMRKLTFAVPMTEDGSFDLERQRALANTYDAVVDAIRTVTDDAAAVLDVVPAVAVDVAD